MKTKSKIKFKPGFEIYNRILWDDDLNPADFIMVVKDRIEGLKELSLMGFDPEEVPWHRVVQFKKDDEIVWDRENKIDLITKKKDDKDA